MPDGLSPEEHSGLSAAGAAAGLGCSIVATIVVFIAGGVAIDEKTGKGPVFTLIGVAVALIAAGYQLVELARVGRKDVPTGPVTRGVQQLTKPLRSRRQKGGEQGPGSVEE